MVYAIVSGLAFDFENASGISAAAHGCFYWGEGQGGSCCPRACLLGLLSAAPNAFLCCRVLGDVHLMVVEGT